MSRKNPPPGVQQGALYGSPPATPVSPDALNAALAIVSTAIRAEASAQRFHVLPSATEYVPRLRLSMALQSIAERIDAARNVPAGTP